MHRQDERTDERPEGAWGGPWVYFEWWLERQKERQDEAGDVARFVLWDTERGCWEDLVTFDTFQLRDEERRKGMARHLIFHHNFDAKIVFAFERVHREFLEAEKRAWRLNPIRGPLTSAG
jgi:hypothetical protein